MKNIFFVLGFTVLIGVFFESFVHGASLSGVVCTMEYAPVCASVQVQCIKAPCDPVKQTFSNSCVAKASGGTNITSGACEDTVPPVIVGGDRDSHGCIPSAGYTWSTSEKKCVRPWEVKASPRQALQDGTWILESYNGKALTHSGTLTFEKNSFNAKLCNTLNGHYGTIGKRLMLRKVASTRMYCDSDLTPVESILTMSSYMTFVVGSDTLTMTTKGGSVVVWKKQ